MLGEEIAVNSSSAMQLTNESARRQRVLIIDDHEMVAMLFRDLVLSLSGYEVVGQAASSAQALQLCAQHRPDLVMLDLVLPDSTGLALLRQIRVLCPEARVLVCSGNLTAPLIRSALLAGATGIIGKAVPLEELKNAIQSVGAGRAYLCGQTSETVRLMVRSSPSVARQHPPLSQRERTVLQHIAAGLSSKEIAAKLGLSRYTVNNFRSKLSKKTGLHRAVQLSRYAAQIGLVDDAEPEEPRRRSADPEGPASRA
jgi:DNA-binding NarL/FixJ family response regulator